MEISTDDLSSLLPECEQLAHIYCAMYKQFSSRMSKISLFLSKIDDVRQLCESGCKWLNKESTSRRENYGSLDWESFSDHNETLGTIERNVAVVLKNRIVWIKKFVDKVGDTQDELEKLYDKISELAVSELENEGNKLSDLYKDFCIEKVKYLKLVPAKISAPQAKAIYSYSQPRRVTRSSGCSELYLSLDEKDNIYSDAYGHHSRSVQVDLSSPDRCEEAEEIFGDNRSSKLEKKKPSQAITSASVHYLSNDSDSDDNITTVSTSMRSQPTIKQTGLFAERNRERLREDTQLKAVALSSESVLDCLPLTLSTSELNVSSTPEEWVAAGSQDNHFSPGVKDTESGESCEKRGKKIVNSAVQRDPGLLNESINSATITDSSSMEPQQSSQSSEQSAAPSCHHESLSTSAITVAKPVRKTPLPSSTCTSAESVTAKDVLTQSVSPFSKDKRLPPGSAHSITNSSNSKPIQITNTSHSSSSSGSSSSSRKRSAGDLAEGNHTHCTTSTRARAAARRKDENDDTAASGFSGNSIHSREKRPRQVKDKSSLVDLTDASGDG